MTSWAFQYEVPSPFWAENPNKQKKGAIMELLITTEDVFNNTNINLAEKLNVGDNGTKYLENWLFDRQEEIFNHIAEYAFLGRLQVEKYLSDQVYKDIIIKAVFEQVKYMLDNEEATRVGGLIMRSGGVAKVSIRDRLDSYVSPKAHQILSNYGLLYRGRR